MYTIDDVINELFEKHSLSKTDISRMVKSQFKVINKTIKSKSSKTCNLIFIGKYKNTPYRVKQLKEIINE